MHFDNNDIVFQVFKKLIEEKGFVIKEVDEEELIHIENDDVDFKISLDNLRKDYAQDANDDTIARFVNAIADTSDLPAWDEAKTGIYPSLFPSDFDFGDFINYPVTESFNMIIVYEDEVKKIWISESQLEEWGIDNQVIIQAAYENLDKVLNNTSLEMEEIDGKKLFYFLPDDETMKAVLIVAKGLKQKVSATIGWPVCAVIPVRDFCYLFSAADFDFFAERLAATVMGEYQQSAYQVTTEILECTDEGIKAIANYELDDENEEQ